MAAPLLPLILFGGLAAFVAYAMGDSGGASGSSGSSGSGLPQKLTPPSDLPPDALTAYPNPAGLILRGGLALAYTGVSLQPGSKEQLPQNLADIVADQLCMASAPLPAAAQNALLKLSTYLAAKGFPGISQLVAMRVGELTGDPQLVASVVTLGPAITIEPKVAAATRAAFFRMLLQQDTGSLRLLQQQAQSAFPVFANTIAAWLLTMGQASQAAQGGGAANAQQQLGQLLAGLGGAPGGAGGAPAGAAGVQQLAQLLAGLAGSQPGIAGQPQPGGQQLSPGQVANVLAGLAAGAGGAPGGGAPGGGTAGPKPWIGPQPTGGTGPLPGGGLPGMVGQIPGMVGQIPGLGGGGLPGSGGITGPSKYKLPSGAQIGPDGSLTYTVASGDYPARIASKFGKKNPNLWPPSAVAANPEISDWTQLQPGQVIRLPIVWADPTVQAPPQPGDAMVMVNRSAAVNSGARQTGQPMSAPGGAGSVALPALPPGAQWVQAPMGPEIRYQLQPGDYPAKIAARFGKKSNVPAWIRAIQKGNHDVIPDWQKARVGQTIRLPASFAQPSQLAPAA